MTSRELLSRLLKDGWIVRSRRGSHHVLVHPEKPGHITLPHRRKDLGTGLVLTLLKQAGLKGPTP